jgi:hypothetical protein
MKNCHQNLKWKTEMPLHELSLVSYECYTSEISILQQSSAAIQTCSYTVHTENKQKCT